MRRHDCRCLIILGLAITLLLAGGCASKSARFYTLNPVIPTSSPGPTQNTALLGPPSSIGIISVEIPDYLDRPQIVTRSPNNELKLAEFDRWAGDLQNDIARVLAETMSYQLADNGVFVLTGRRTLPSEYRITVQIDRFEAVPGEQVWLKALWTVWEKDGRRVLMRGGSNISETAQGSDYGATVAAMSRSVDRLGAQIADAMKPNLERSAAVRRGQALAQQQAPAAGASPLSGKKNIGDAGS